MVALGDPPGRFCGGPLTHNQAKRRKACQRPAKGLRKTKTLEELYLDELLACLHAGPLLCGVVAMPIDPSIALQLRAVRIIMPTLPEDHL